MKADSTSFLELIESPKRIYKIPVYQRKYDWKKEQCETLFNDIESIANDTSGKSHFIGTIVYVDEYLDSSFHKLTIIDGQQRLTTIMLLLKAIADSGDNTMLKEEINNTYLKNTYCNKSLEIKLCPIEADAKIYRDLINGNLDDQSEYESNVIKNYKLFKDLISASTLDIKDIFLGIQKLSVVCINLEAGKENPQIIFESLNSTGLDLTQADLIRNYLLMSEEPSIQEELYNTYWSKLEELLPSQHLVDFFRDYITLKTSKIPKKDDVYYTFKKYHNALNCDLTTLFKELTNYAKYYDWFISCNSNNPKINSYLKDLQELKCTTVYPFLLFLFAERFTENKITNDDLYQSFDVIFSYIVRRLLCEYPTNSLNKIFASMKLAIDKNKKPVMEAKISDVLLSKKGKELFPNDTLLKEKVSTLELYKDNKDNLRTKFILSKIATYLNPKEPVDCYSNNISIEHIMPQKLTKDWEKALGQNYSEIHAKYQHNIGNLTLTAYNPELSNDIFSKKKEIYKNSNITLTRNISAKYDTWGENEIVSRCNNLIEIMSQIWKYPGNASTVAYENTLQKEFNIFGDFNPTGKTPYEFEFNDETLNVNSWISILEIICKYLYESNSDLFTALSKHQDFNNKSFFASNAEVLRAPFQLNQNLYIEKNFSAKDILRYSKILLEKFDYDWDSDCIIRIK